MLLSQTSFSPIAIATSNSTAKRILLVDEPADVAGISIRLLNSMGLEVTTAQSGQEAGTIALLAHNSGEGFEAILINVNDSMFEGVETIRSLSGSGIEAVIIAICDCPGDETEQQSREAGCNDFIARPLDFCPICQSLQKFLS